MIRRLAPALSLALGLTLGLAAASSLEMWSGIRTARLAGRIRWVAYAPGALTEPTRSPTAKPSTPSPTATTAPAASDPSAIGSGAS